ncbi:Hypothetical protein ETEE_2791 [Edwardsiella anguillarum ET080813]|uniref:Uncharacterized protein n=1 Tax=Edwardsiella anguillarum ET080813 TaxID=667120 RepID=A0A076LUH3_9GAMM|nr:Hypothetical protein ETEE_2791 [Edwardsiella anguillarum ET080813]
MRGAPSGGDYSDVNYFNANGAIIDKRDSRVFLDKIKSQLNEVSAE